jgi:dUTP pyrophosphatase
VNKQQVIIKIKDEAFIPSYATDLSAGADLRAFIDKEISLLPNQVVLIPTGICLDLPINCEAQIRPRSGLALKHKITVLNTPGTIDADYRGEVGVILINHGNDVFIIKPKMRIAQLILAPVYRADFIIKEDLDSSVRGNGGFGHSGTD